MSRPYWLSAFLDLPADRHAAGTAFWSEVTGYAVSDPRGPHGEFATLVPPDGDDYLRVQRVEDGEPRIHVDVHVDDPRGTADELTARGARVVADEGDYLTLTSPGGMVFCLVSHPAGRRPPPATRSGGHASYVDQVCLDIPPSRYDAELDFWHALTGWARRDPRPGSEFGRLTPDQGQPLQLLLQRLDDEQDRVTAHLDWASTDHAAEIDRHVRCGAEERGDFEGWTVLVDPTGMAYCVTRRTAGDRP